MLTSNEIYYLNTALEGEYVYGIDPLKAKAKEDISSKGAEKSLIEKRYLKEDGSVDNLGIIFLNHLHNYKNADNYIWVDGKVIAFNNRPYLITLSREDSKIYKFERKLKAQIVAQIFKDKPFLLGDNQVKEDKKVVSVNKITNILELKDESEVLYLRREKDENISFYNVYFKEDNSIFKYDVLKKTLSLINPREVRGEILDLFNIRRGE